MDESRRRLALPDGHLERFDDELGAHVLGHRPADDPARVAVDHDGQVELALPRRDLGQIGDPQPIRRGRVEVARDQIRRRAHTTHADRRLAAPADQQAAQAGLAHQPRNALAARVDAAVTQLGVKPPPPVAALALVVDLADQRQQPVIAARPRRARALLPGVVAGPADAEHAAQQGDGML
jgi:hypothetical protein